MPLNVHLRKLWLNAGYEDGHSSDAVVPPAPVGFRRLYYLTSADHAVSNIVFKRIKVSRFSELNDPFELLGQNFGDRDIRRLVREHKNQFNRENGLICFSADWADPVLWSHYAAKHSGVALGFDIKLRLVKEVTYTPTRLKQKIRYGTNRISGELAELLICTKFSSWSYEREWRLLANLSSMDKEGGLYFTPLSRKLKLVEVILGATCTLNLKNVRTLANNHHQDVTSYRARLALRSFRVIPMRSSVPLRAN